MPARTEWYGRAWTQHGLRQKIGRSVTFGLLTNARRSGEKASGKSPLPLDQHDSQKMARYLSRRFAEPNGRPPHGTHVIVISNVNRLNTPDFR